LEHSADHGDGRMLLAISRTTDSYRLGATRLCCRERGPPQGRSRRRGRARCGAECLGRYAPPSTISRSSDVVRPPQRVHSSSRDQNRSRDNGRRTPHVATTALCVGIACMTGPCCTKNGSPAISSMVGGRDDRRFALVLEPFRASWGAGQSRAKSRLMPAEKRLSNHSVPRCAASAKTGKFQ